MSYQSPTESPPMFLGLKVSNLGSQVKFWPPEGKLKWFIYRGLLLLTPIIATMRGTLTVRMVTSTTTIVTIYMLFVVWVAERGIYQFWGGMGFSILTYFNFILKKSFLVLSVGLVKISTFLVGFSLIFIFFKIFFLNKNEFA